MSLEEGRKLTCIEPIVEIYTFAKGKNYEILERTLIGEYENYYYLLDEKGTKAFLAEIVINNHFKVL